MDPRSREELEDENLGGGEMTTRRKFTMKELMTALTAPCFKTLQCVSINKETAFKHLYECPAAVRCFFEFTSREFASTFGIPESQRAKMRLKPGAEKKIRENLREQRKKYLQKETRR